MDGFQFCFTKQGDEGEGKLGPRPVKSTALTNGYKLPLLSLMSIHIEILEGLRDLC